MVKAKVKKKVAFKVGDGQTRNISDGVTRFLGSPFASSAQANRKEAGKHSWNPSLGNSPTLTELPSEASIIVDIYKWYLVQSIHFFLSVNNIPSATIS